MTNTVTNTLTAPAAAGGGPGSTRPAAAGTTQTTAAGGTTATTSSNGGLGKDAFLKLLVAQMQYQDPMSPTDGQAYMTQMATFTQVEKLGDLVTAQSQAAAWQQKLAAEGLVGRQVSGTSTDSTGKSTAETGTVVSVKYGTGDPQLVLSDGSSLAVGDVTEVTTPKPTGAGTTTTGTTGTTGTTSPAMTGTTGPATTGTTRMTP